MRTKVYQAAALQQEFQLNKVWKQSHKSVNALRPICRAWTHEYRLYFVMRQLNSHRKIHTALNFSKNHLKKTMTRVKTALIDLELNKSCGRPGIWANKLQLAVNQKQLLLRKLTRKVKERARTQTLMSSMMKNIYTEKRRRGDRSNSKSLIRSLLRKDLGNGWYIMGRVTCLTFKIMK